MKTLFVTHNYIDGPGGGAFATTAYINAFTAISDCITVLYPYRGKKCLHINPKAEMIPVGYDKHRIHKLFDLLCGRVHRYCGVVEAYLNKDYDLVVFDTSVVSFGLIKKFCDAKKKTVCIHHNYQYEYFKDNAKWPLSIPTLYWCKKYEQDAVRLCDLNLALTNQDIDLLRTHYGIGDEKFAKIGVFEYEPRTIVGIQDRERKECPVFAITGSLGTYQTERSLLIWLKSYYPILRRLYPQHKLLIAGRSPSQNLFTASQSYSEIEIIPDPDNMDDVLKNADYYLCPTSLGGGLKLRIMDGLRNGLLVCTHTVSARGYDDLIGKNVFPYNDIDTFKKTLSSMARCRKPASEISEEYARLFAFDTGVDRLKAILELYNMK